MYIWQIIPCPSASLVLLELHSCSRKNLDDLCELIEQNCGHVLGSGLAFSVARLRIAWNKPVSSDDRPEIKDTLQRLINIVDPV